MAQTKGSKRVEDKKKKDNKKSKSSNKTKNKADAGVVDNIWGVIFVAVGIFLFAAINFNAAGAVGGYLKDFFLGTLGLVGLIIPLYLIIFGILLFMNKTVHISIWTFLTAFLVLLMLGLINSGHFIDIKHIDFDFIDFYKKGISLEGGGLLPMPLAIILTMYLGKVGLYTIAIVVIIISLLLIINTPVSQGISNFKNRKKRKEERRLIEEAEKERKRVLEEKEALKLQKEREKLDAEIEKEKKRLEKENKKLKNPIDISYLDEVSDKNKLDDRVDVVDTEDSKLKEKKKNKLFSLLMDKTLFSNKSQNQENSKIDENSKSKGIFEVDKDIKSKDNLNLSRSNTGITYGLDENVDELLKILEKSKKNQGKSDLFNNMDDFSNFNKDFSSNFNDKCKDIRKDILGKEEDSHVDNRDFGIVNHGVNLDFTSKFNDEKQSLRDKNFFNIPEKKEGSYGEYNEALETLDASNELYSKDHREVYSKDRGNFDYEKDQDSNFFYDDVTKETHNYINDDIRKHSRNNHNISGTSEHNLNKDLNKDFAKGNIAEKADSPLLSKKEAKALNLKPDDFVKNELKVEYKKPPLGLLNPPVNNKNKDISSILYEKAKVLEETLHNFKVNAKVINVSQGPAVTRFEIQPDVGVKVSKIVSLSDDIALNLRAKSIRMEAPIPGKAAVGIEIENEKIDMVSIRTIIDSKAFEDSRSKITFAVGKDISGKPVVADLKSMPHLLIAGSTGSGKSVCINSIIVSLLYKANPDEVKLVLVDPKVVELGNYNGIPHLLVPVVTDPNKAAATLNWAVAEMTKRYKSFAKYGVRDIAGFNDYVKKYNEERTKLEASSSEEKLPPRDTELEHMPQIVIIIDELADLMMASPSQVEESICRLAQMARAAGMHLIVATQRPSVDIITGVIKANIPSRIAFAVSSQFDSRTILDMGGAEKLVGKGDMLFNPIGSGKPVRVQGCFISDEEVRKVIDYIKEQGKETKYSEEVIDTIEKGNSVGRIDDNVDELLKDAIDFVVDSGQASTSMLQRRFRIGYNRGARIMDMMEERGIVGPQDGSRPRQILVTKEELEDLEKEK